MPRGFNARPGMGAGGPGMGAAMPMPPMAGAHGGSAASLPAGVGAEGDSNQVKVIRRTDFQLQFVWKPTLVKDRAPLPETPAPATDAAVDPAVPETSTPPQTTPAEATAPPAAPAQP